MAKITPRSELIDGLLRIAALGSLTATLIVAPGALQALDKPLGKFLERLDEADRQREISKALSYIRYQKLIEGDYQHGISITKKAKRRLAKRSIGNLSIEKPNIWDKQWRIVFFDIPEVKKRNRDLFVKHLRSLGFAILQRSVFISPYPCRNEVSVLTEYFGVSDDVTYIETTYIDNDRPLRTYFKL